MNRENSIKKLVEIIKPYMSGLACEQESGSCELTSCNECRATELANKIYDEDFHKLVRKNIRYVHTDDYGRPLWYECPECKKASTLENVNDVIMTRFCQHCGTLVEYVEVE